MFFNAFTLILVSLTVFAFCDDMIVDPPAANLNWTSQTFVIPTGRTYSPVFPGISFEDSRRENTPWRSPRRQDPNPRNYLIGNNWNQPVHPRNDTGEACGRFSRFYCLNAYETTLSSEVIAYDFGYSHQMVVDLQFMQLMDSLHSNSDEFCQQDFQAMYRRHNFFYGRDGCCSGQCDYYRQHGYARMMFTLPDYISRLTDYSHTTGKELNLIRAFFLPRCRVNVITKVGFGSGFLQREPHPYISRVPLNGFPYVLGLDDPRLSVNIPFDNPEDFLTFKWFKYNVICREQYWICSQDIGESSGSRDQFPLPPYRSASHHMEFKKRRLQNFMTHSTKKQKLRWNRCRQRL